MNKRALFSLLVLLISSTLTSSLLHSASLMLGTIQFPQSIRTVPTIRIYCGGRIIPCSLDHKNKLISFSIPKYAQQFNFNLLITEKVSFVPAASKYQSTGNNTAAYLTIADGQPYKLYSLLLAPEFTGTGENTQLRYTWHIKNEPMGQKIPDDAIIICYDPALITGMRGSNSFELPTININQNVLKLCGSEKSFYDKSMQIMLASLDTDTMHAMQEQQLIKQEENRITIAAPAA